MAVYNPTNTAYGLSQALINVFPPPIVAERNPTTADKAAIGTVWINKFNSNIYMITSIVDNVAEWVLLSSDGGTILFLEGNTGGPVGPNASNTVFVKGDGTGITIAGNPGTNTLTASLIGGGTAAQIFHGDTGTATPDASGNITFEAAITAGRTVSFSASSHTLELNASDPHNNTAIGNEAGNTGTGSNNTSLGFSALGGTGTGSNNTAIGYEAGLNYTGTESNNIQIGSSVGGTLGESNVLRIGTGTGTGTGQLSKAFISGIDGINVGSVTTVVTEFGNQLGTAVLSPGTGISITAGANVITIAASGTSTLNYTAVSASPYVVLSSDQYLGVNSTSSAITIELPNAPAVGRVWIIKDTTGSAATHNITVTTVGGAVNIDGATTFVMNTNFEAINVIGNSTSYEVY